MFGIGIPELILIAVVALIVVGPKDLPVTLRAIGRAIREFQRASRELRKEAGFDEVVDEVTRPLREGLAGIEADVLREAEDSQHEYPEGGPDDYDALPEGARVYPELVEQQPTEPPVAPETAVRTQPLGTVQREPGAAPGAAPGAQLVKSTLTREAVIEARLAAARAREAAIKAKLMAIAPEAQTEEQDEVDTARAEITPSERA